MNISHRKTNLLIFFFFFIFQALFTKTTVTGWGDMARLATIESLVERHTFAIERSTFAHTGDKIEFQGHYYGAQPPVLPAIGSVVYQCLHRILGLSFSSQLRPTYYLITLIMMGIPAVILLVVFYQVLRYILDSQWSRFLLTMALCWGTLIFTYSVYFNSQSSAAVCLFLAFVSLLKAVKSGKNPGWYLFGGGLASGLAFTVDPIPGGVFMVMFFSYVAVKLRSSFALRFYLPGTLLPLFLYVILNLSMTGTLKPTFLYPGCPASWRLVKHYNAADFSRYCFQSLLGIRGWFSYSPLLLLSFYYLLKTAFQGKSFLVWEARFILGGVCLSAFFSLLVSRAFGGFCYGMRYLIPLTPLVLFFLGFSISPGGFWRRSLFYLFFTVSVLITFIGVAKPGSSCSPGKCSLMNNINYLRSQDKSQWVRLYLPVFFIRR